MLPSNRDCGKLTDAVALGSGSIRVTRASSLIPLEFLIAFSTGPKLTLKDSPEKLLGFSSRSRRAKLSRGNARVLLVELAGMGTVLANFLRL